MGHAYTSARAPRKHHPPSPSYHATSARAASGCPLRATTPRNTTLLMATKHPRKSGDRPGIVIGSPIQSLSGTERTGELQLRIAGTPRLVDRAFVGGNSRIGLAAACAFLGLHCPWLARMSHRLHQTLLAIGEHDLAEIEPRAVLWQAALWVGLSIAGCASGPVSTTGGAHGSPRRDDVQITVERLTPQDAWRATYELAAPVRELRFTRRVGSFRVERWKVLTPGIAIEPRGDAEVLVSAAPFDRVQLTFESMYSSAGKDYELCVRFSDDSIALYTGHLLAEPAHGENARRATHRFTFLQPDPSRALLVAGQERRGASVDWRDEPGEGTYVYYGGIRVMVRPQFAAVLDPALPAWLLERVDALLPRLFDYYTQRTGTPLQFKPTVLLAFRPTASTGASHAGGTLPGLVLLSLQGSAWNRLEPSREREIFHFMAHESAHLWNRRMFQPVDGPSWMHEGGAESFAYHALLDFRIIDRKEYAEAHRQALDDCRDALAGGSLEQSYQRVQARSAYRCGLVLALITEAAARPAAPDIFDFWRRLFARARTDGDHYSEETYLATLAETARSPAVMPAFRSLLREQSQDWTDPLVAALRAAGLSVDVAESEATEEYNRQWGLNALRQLTKNDCGGNASLTRKPDHVIIEGSSGCKHLVVTTPIDRIEGRRILEEGALAYDAAAARCKSEAVVALGVYRSAELIVLPCSDLRNRPRVVALHDLP